MKHKTHITQTKKVLSAASINNIRKIIRNDLMFIDHTKTHLKFESTFFDCHFNWTNPNKRHVIKSGAAVLETIRITSVKSHYIRLYSTWKQWYIRRNHIRILGLQISRIIHQFGFARCVCLLLIFHRKLPTFIEWK